MEDPDAKPAAASPAQPHDPQALRIVLLATGGLRSACVAALLERCDERITTVVAESAAALEAQPAVHVALMPLLWPNGTALSEVSDAIQALGSLPLAVLLDRSEAPIVQRLGTRGVLTLDLDIKVVAPALHLVAAGGLYLPPQPGGYGSADMGFAAAASEPAGRRPRGLSPREQAVLDLLPRSLSNREIAAALGIAEATVKIHMRNLLRKTRARNRVELALLAARRSG